MRLMHRRLNLEQIDLHFVEMGEGPLIVLLHGFPEFWYSWRHQLLPLAKAGFRVVAPDMRGYNESSRPYRVCDYRVQLLVEDIGQLIDQLENGPAHVVGHDWGGVIAWRLAALHPQKVNRLVILNAPHPAAFRRELLRNPVQWLRSWYALFFQLPALPELLLRAGGWAVLEHGWRRQPLRPGAFTETDIERYKAALHQPGALTGSLNYYRAALRWSGDIYGLPQAISAPTLVLWGDQDPFLSLSLTEQLRGWVPNLDVIWFANASHWIQQDLPAEVSAAVIDFCGAQKRPFFERAIKAPG